MGYRDERGDGGGRTFGGDTVIRIYHQWSKWECYPSGFYEPAPPPGMTPQQANDAYTEFLRDIPRFERGLYRVLADWKNSCEHYLSNETMNRIAWLGQAAMCIETHVPAGFRGGFNQLTESEKLNANQAALDALNLWLISRGEPEVTMEGAGVSARVNLY